MIIDFARSSTVPPQRAGIILVLDKNQNRVLFVEL
jgi:hypothetical protein